MLEAAKEFIRAVGSEIFEDHYGDTISHRIHSTTKLRVPEGISDWVVCVIQNRSVGKDEDQMGGGSDHNCGGSKPLQEGRDFTNKRESSDCSRPGTTTG
ncbi:hypothetical protein TSUD_165120 [Trifolium subterraneum]|uniref:Uncharacterized protein n=1 Tax=Trifolium subterraneum TaxID=3900 RepID=A0A2Z6M900_TRISU|nr:hypothetical protein TSUD_165120 [Trifolium subterraneum]